jgi:hypothetical protein
MNMRWLIGNFTDPHYNVPRKEQMRLSNVAHKRHLSTVRFLLWTLIVIVAPFVLFLGFIFPWIMGSIGFNSQSSAYWGVLFASIFIIFWPWSAWMYRALYVRPIRRAMREVGFDLCIDCGYDLRHLPEATEKCPECGMRRAPMLKA